MTEVDRRDFLRGAGFATAAAAVPIEAAAEADIAASGRNALRLDALYRLQGVRGRL
jgi:hypothetical protein